MTDRERLINLMIEAKRTDPETGSFTDYLADYLLEHGVIVLPCKVGKYEKGRREEMKKILDACCGSRMFWFDKENKNVDFCDLRVLDTTLCDGRTLEIKPDIVCDFTKLPMKDNTYYLVVFDPPHLLKVGDNSWLAQKYGKLPQDNWQEILRKGFSERMRVLKPNGTLIFKWNETDVTVSKIIDVIGQTPLFGHKSGKRAKTHWLCFMKESEVTHNDR